MSKIAEITVKADGFLAANKYEVDEGNPHIELVDDPDTEEFLKLVRVCPAALYKIDADGNKSFDYAGCLECGTCRVACEGTIVKKWDNPRRRKVDGGSDSPIQVRHALAKGVGLAGVHPARIRLVRRKIAGAGRLRYCTSRAASLVE